MTMIPFGLNGISLLFNRLVTLTNSLQIENVSVMKIG